jgi:protein N-terminal glutamine amidohydrolase
MRGENQAAREIVGKLHYARFYCEENVWYLGQELMLKRTSKRAVFISNRQRQCLFRYQQPAHWESVPITYDYHVVLMALGTKWQIWDLDTTLAFPISISEYVDLTFQMKRECSSLLPSFRVVEFDEFRESFSSDRSHMRDSAGQWIAPPPPWDLIGERSESNLMDFVDMERESFGKVLSIRDFRKEYAGGD